VSHESHQVGCGDTGAAGESFGEACAALLDKVFAQYVAAEDVAALIVEPVQGEGGFVVPPDDYLPALKRRCEQRGIVFIAAEVQTGFGRTGTLFAFEQSGVEPDLVVLAKSLGCTDWRTSSDNRSLSEHNYRYPIRQQAVLRWTH
jgi:4-aminobutyrate aminotransferase-like enzyme